MEVYEAYGDGVARIREAVMENQVHDAWNPSAS